MVRDKCTHLVVFDFTEGEKELDAIMKGVFALFSSLCVLHHAIDATDK